MSRIVVKKKGEDDNLVTSVRLPRELVNRLDKFAAKTDLSAYCQSAVAGLRYCGN